MKKIILIAVVSFLVAITAYFFLFRSNGEGVPKPRGYFRIALPEKEYLEYKTDCALSMEVPAYARIELLRQHPSADSCWFNVFYPRLNARIHCTYLPVKGNAELLISDAYGMALSHEMKASGLKRTRINDPERNVYGLMYDIQGEAASQVQFFLTDSSSHFFRGSLYFFNAPNPDSIEPVLAFIREDIERICKTVQWK